MNLGKLYRPLIAAVCLSLELSAVELHSLPEMLELAEKNPALTRDMEGLRKSAEAKIRQVQMEKWLSTLELTAYTGVVPDVNADAAVRNQSANQLLFNTDSNDFENGFSFSRLGPFGKLELRAVQPLLTFGKIGGYEDMAASNMRMIEAERQKEIQQVRYLVKRAYYIYQLSQEGLVILKDVREKLKQAEEKVEELLIKNSENVEETDRLKIKVFLSDVENRSLDAEKGLRLARSGLMELTGIVGDLQVDQVMLKAEVVQDIEKEAIISKTLRYQPELVRLDQYIDIKKAERATIKSALFPTVFLAGELNYSVAPGRTDIKSPFIQDEFNAFNLGVALGLKQDLGFHRTLNKMEEINADILRLGAQRERLGSLARIKAEEAFEKAIAAHQGIEINERGFRAARSWLTSAGLAFNLGTAPTKDVLESYAAYFKSRVDLIRSTFELNMALSELSLATGEELVSRLK